jgi:hypothetical protein
MQAKPKILSAAIAATLAMGLVGEASASIYARSYLEFNNLSIAIIDAAGNPAATLGNWQMSGANTASLNGTALQGDDFICQGTAASNNCGPLGTRVDALAANGLGSVPQRANNDFSFFGPGVNEYANSDSLISRSELTGDGPSATKQIAETELQTGTSARANAELQSITNLTFSFTVTGANRLIISFDSLSSSFVQIDDLAALFASAQSNREVELSLQNDTTGDFILWRPNGNPNSGVGTSLVGATWTETDTADLQEDFGVTLTPQSCSGNNFSVATPCVAPKDQGDITLVAGAHNLNFVGLTDGVWTLTLSALTSTQVSRQVPLPGTLALLGLGLAGLGLASRRRKQA